MVVWDKKIEKMNNATIVTYTRPSEATAPHSGVLSVTLKFYEKTAGACFIVHTNNPDGLLQKCPNNEFSKKENNLSASFQKTPDTLKKLLQILLECEPTLDLDELISTLTQYGNIPLSSIEMKNAVIFGLAEKNDQIPTAISMAKAAQSQGEYNTLWNLIEFFKKDAINPNSVLDPNTVNHELIFALCEAVDKESPYYSKAQYELLHRLMMVEADAQEPAEEKIARLEAIFFHALESKEQTMIDPIFNELSGGTGFSPSVKNITGDYVTLINLARQIRTLTEQNQKLLKENQRLLEEHQKKELVQTDKELDQKTPHSATENAVGNAISRTIFGSSEQTEIRVTNSKKRPLEEETDSSQDTLFPPTTPTTP